MDYLIVREVREVETGEGESIEIESFEIFDKESYNTLAKSVDEAIERWFAENEIYSLYMGGDIFIEYMSPEDFWSGIDIEEITEVEYSSILRIVGKNCGLNFNFLHNILTDIN